MDLRTGEIFQETQNKKLEDWLKEHPDAIPIHNLPKADCPDCGGMGRVMPKGKTRFEACHCVYAKGAR